MSVTVTDLFCGAGGSSSGAELVPGVRVRMAANHWALAVETHNRNLPHADHDIANISQVDPRRYPRTDVLWASPECTNHSQAKGRRRTDAQPDLFGEVLPDAAAERSRATMFDVLRFAEHHRYAAIVVENVVDVRDWVLWPAWVTGLDNLGYDHTVVYLNSMFAQAVGPPAPQSRDRFYVVAWRHGNRAPDVARWTRPPAWCPACDRQVRAVQAWKRPDRPRGRYAQQYLYRCPVARCSTELHPGVLPAAVAIDWALVGVRIGDRTRPLAEKTIARIAAGLKRYARPIHLEAAGHTFERRPGVRTWPVDEPLRTVHTSSSKALACPPFLTPMRSGRPRTIGVDEPLATVVADGSNHGLVDPFLVPAGGTWNDDARTIAEPFRTRTTRDAEALVVPLRNNGRARPADTEPAPTVAAAGNHHALVMRNMTARGDQGQMSTPVTEPLRTILAEQCQSLIRWDHLLVPYGRTGLVRGVDEPMPAQTTIQGDGLLGPQIAVDDCTFRMLEPHEIQAAMAFGPAYVVLGNKRERVRQLGNAVTPPAARDLIAAVVEALTGEAVA
ncbi:MAG: DNA cytosine methyltransferase [Micromonosporaceae bacterium]